MGDKKIQKIISWTLLSLLFPSHIQVIIMIKKMEIRRQKKVRNIFLSFYTSGTNSRIKRLKREGRGFHCPFFIWDYTCKR